MTQETNQTLTNPIYFVSPSGKIHAKTCRHCQPQKEGWQRLESFTSGIEQGYQTCRLCCPSDAKKQVVSLNPLVTVSHKLNPEENISTVTVSQNEPLETLMIETSTNSETADAETKITSVEKDSPSEDKTESNNQKTPKHKSIDKEKTEKNKLNSNDKKEKSTEKKKTEKSEPKVEKKRYKILAGNGCHQAIAEVQGILIPPSEPDQNFLLILPDGFQIEATFKTPRLHWIARNQETMLGSHWFRGYPKMKENKLISLQIIAWDKGMPTNPRGFETWEFTGVWTAQKNITVQRSMMIEDVRQIAKETGFIKKFKYTFINSFDWVKNKKLWMGYVYKILCQRRGDTLEIKKVIPYACPRYKPDPKGFVKKDDGKGNYKKNDVKSNYNKGGKKEFKPNQNKPNNQDN